MFDAKSGQGFFHARPSRGVRRRLALAALMLASGCASLPATEARAPMVKSQAPGFYRMMVGDVEVTALNDGVVDFSPAKLLTNTTPADVGSGSGSNRL